MGYGGAVPYGNHNTARVLTVIAAEEAAGEVGGMVGAGVGSLFAGWGAIPGAIIVCIGGDALGGWSAGRKFDQETALSSDEIWEIINGISLTEQRASEENINRLKSLPGI